MTICGLIIWRMSPLGNDLLVAVLPVVQIHEQVLRHVGEIRDNRAGGTERRIAGVDGHFVSDFLVVLAVGVRHIAGRLERLAESRSRSYACRAA